MLLIENKGINFINKYFESICILYFLEINLINNQFVLS